MKRFAAALLMLWPLIWPLIWPLAAQADPAVLELFTSQGCSACPPADKLLEKLQQEPGVFALSYHVTYWDRAGWVDPFGLNTATLRQYEYQTALKLPNVFTPQLVVNGTWSIVGSNEDLIRHALEETHKKQTFIAFSVSDKGITFPETGKDFWMTVEIIGYQARGENDVTAGENDGQHLTSTNVVRSVTEIGRWTGQAKTISYDFGKDGLSHIVLLRDRKTKQIIGLQNVPPVAAKSSAVPAPAPSSDPAPVAPAVPASTAAASENNEPLPPAQIP